MPEPSYDVRKLPQQNPRIESGPVKFGDDWTGLFIRGDNAFFYGQKLREMIAAAQNAAPEFVDPFLVPVCIGLAELLESSRER